MRPFVKIFALSLSCITLPHGFAQNLTLSGDVVQSDGRPVGRALVEYSSVSMSGGKLSQSEGEAFTDASGRFRFDGLFPAHYSLTVTRPQFDTAQQSLELKVTGSPNVHFSLNMYAVVSGKVADLGGHPLSGVNVRLQEIVVEDGRRRLRQARNTVTDDIGEFRMWNIRPGNYLLHATGRAGVTALLGADKLPTYNPSQCFVPTYLGGATDWHTATPVELAWGKVFTTDFHLGLQPALRIRGTLTGVGAFQRAKFRLVDDQDNEVATRAVLSGAGGHFELLDVPPGNYLLKVQQGDGEGTIFGEARVRVSDGDLENVGISLRSGATVTITQHCTVEANRNEEFQSLERPGRNFTGRGQDSCVDVALSRGGQILNPPFLNLEPGTYDLALRQFGHKVSDLRFNGQAIQPGSSIHLGDGAGVIEVWGEGYRTEVAFDFRGIEADNVGVLAVPLVDSFSGPIVIQGLRLPLRSSSLPPGDYNFFALRTSDLSKLEFRNPTVLKSLTAGVSGRSEQGKTVTVEIRGIAK